jgi:hypothetical protein
MGNALAQGRLIGRHTYTPQLRQQPRLLSLAAYKRTTERRRAMDKKVFAVLIIGGAMLAATALIIYFSPTQSCVRESKARGMDDQSAQYSCLHS